MVSIKKLFVFVVGVSAAVIDRRDYSGFNGALKQIEIDFKTLKSIATIDTVSNTLNQIQTISTHLRSHLSTVHTSETLSSGDTDNLLSYVTDSLRFVIKDGLEALDQKLPEVKQSFLYGNFGPYTKQLKTDFNNFDLGFVAKLFAQAQPRARSVFDAIETQFDITVQTYVYP